MAWRGAASPSFLAAIRGRSASAAPSIRTAAEALPSAPRRRIPSLASSSATLSTARPLAAMMGLPLAVAGRLTGHSASVRACCELSQGTLFCGTCQDR